MTTAKTKDLTDSLSKDAVLSKLIPSSLCHSQPVPLIINNVPCLGYYFYEIVGRIPQYSLLSAPLYRVIINKHTGRVIEAANGLTFLPSNINLKKPAARFPGQGLAGKAIEEQNLLINNYFDLCDKLLDSFDNKPLDQSPVYPEWKSAFETVMEEGMEQCYKELLNYKQTQIGALIEENQKSGSGASSKPVSNNKAQSEKSAKETLSIQKYLGLIEDFITRAKCSNLKTQLKTVREMDIRNDFKIAVIGEFSRGKSHFLNKLLGTELLAERITPTTALVTQIENGTPSALHHVVPGKSPQKLEVSPESFRRFVADDNGNDPAGVLMLTLPIDWFNGQNIKLFDTPGSGDIVGKRAELTLEAIQTCDSVIMTIAAQAPCSLTEMAFLHDNVVLKATPKVSILISKLDLVNANERLKDVKFIQDKIRSEVPNAKFWTIMTQPDISEQTEKLFDASGIPAIRKAIAEIAGDEDLLRLRSIQTVTMLRGVAVQAQQSVKAQLTMLNKSKEQRLAKLEEIKRQKNEKSALWNRLKLEVNNSKMETIASMEENLNKIKDKLYNELSFQLDKSSSPSEWVEKDFKFNLRRNIEGVSNTLEKELLHKFALCQQSLIKETSKQFGVTVESVDFGKYTLENEVNDQSTDNPKLTNLGRYQQLSRVVFMGSTPLTYMLIGPFAAFITAGSVWFASEVIKSQIEQQKRLVKIWLQDNLDNVFEELHSILDEYIHNGYEKILVNIQSSAQKWLETQENAYEQACKRADNDFASEPLEKLITESQSLIQEFDLYINPNQK